VLAWRRVGLIPDSPTGRFNADVVARGTLDRRRLFPPNPPNRSGVSPRAVIASQEDESVSPSPQMRTGLYQAHPMRRPHARRRSAFTGAQCVRDPGSQRRPRASNARLPTATTNAIELDDDRANAIRAALSQDQLLTPANFIGCRASLNSVSLTKRNLPFDLG
jgi:hypothetical protein